MKVKLETSTRLLMIEIHEPLEKFKQPGEWAYIPETRIQYGLDDNFQPYIGGWLIENKAREFLSLVDAFCKERRILIGERNGVGKMDFRLDFEPAEFH